MPAPTRQIVRWSASLNGTTDVLMNNFIDSVLLMPTAPGRALTSVDTDRLDIATDKVGHIGHCPGHFGQRRRLIHRFGWHCGPSLTGLTGGPDPGGGDGWEVAFQIGFIRVVVTRWYSEVSAVCDVKVLWEIDSVLFADVCLNTHLGRGPNPSWAGCQIQSFTGGGSRPLRTLPSTATGA
jgi:hypothetical protein